MGFFDFLWRKPARPSDSDLRGALFSAVEHQDNEALHRLCKDNYQIIHDAFPNWQSVPAEIREDSVARDRYGQGLVGVASFFDQAGDPSLMAWMIGNQSDNLIIEWQQDLAQAQSLIAGGQSNRAIELLLGTLSRTNGSTGSGVDQYLPKTLGMLGIAFHHAGNSKKAAEFTRRAKLLCEELGDEEGIRAYAGNLQQMGE